jgi:hypothetical protein
MSAKIKAKKKTAAGIEPRLMWQDMDGSLHRTKAIEGPCKPLVMLDASAAGREALREGMMEIMQKSFNANDSMVMIADAILSRLGMRPAKRGKGKAV